MLVELLHWCYLTQPYCFSLRSCQCQVTCCLWCTTLILIQGAIFSEHPNHTIGNADWRFVVLFLHSNKGTIGLNSSREGWANWSLWKTAHWLLHQIINLNRWTWKWIKISIWRVLKTFIIIYYLYTIYYFSKWERLLKEKKIRSAGGRRPSALYGRAPTCSVRGHFCSPLLLR